jgi:hypothetical protein
MKVLDVLVFETSEMADHEGSKRQKRLIRRRGACEVCKQRKVRCKLKRNLEHDSSAKIC